MKFDTKLLLRRKKNPKIFSGRLLTVFLNGTNLSKLNCLMRYELI